jgi:hypothetical protein
MTSPLEWRFKLRREASFFVLEGRGGRSNDMSISQRKQVRWIIQGAPETRPRVRLGCHVRNQDRLEDSP